jgi:hypothetical protein
MPDGKRHPGPFRVMQIDSEFAGILVALAFVVLGFVSMPTLAPVFLIGSIAVAVVVVLLLRATRKGRL